jgi:hypothetical protein
MFQKLSSCRHAGGKFVYVLRVEGSATFYVLGMVGVSVVWVFALLEHPGVGGALRCNVSYGWGGGGVLKILLYIPHHEDNFWKRP